MAPAVLAPVAMHRTLLLALLMSGCVGQGDGDPYGQAGVDFQGRLLDVLPTPVTVHWTAPFTDCERGLTGDTVCSGGEAHAYRVTAARCDRCEVLVATSEGLRPFAAQDGNTVVSNDVAVYARSTAEGPGTLTLELTSIDGVHDSVTFQIVGDRMASLAAQCDVWDRASRVGACDQLATRPAGSTIDVILSGTTVRGVGIALFAIGNRGNKADDPMRPFLPTLTAGTTVLHGDLFHLSGPLPPSLTVTWGGVTPLEIGLPPAASAL